MTRRSVSFISNHGTMGGGEVMLFHMAGAASHICDVTVVGPAGPNELQDRCHATGLEYLDVGGHSRVPYLRHLRRALRGHEVDLLWCNGGPPALAAAGLDRPRVVHLHQIPSRVQQPLVALSRRNVLATYAPSSVVAEKLPGADRLPNWTDRPSGPERGPVTGAVRRIGYLGRLSPIKGVDVLAMAIAELRQQGEDVELVLAGDYRFSTKSDRRTVDRALAEVGTGVERLGWVPAQNLFDRVDVLVVPSTWAEPFGLVVAEAMAAGLPVVVSNAGALGEVVGAEYPWTFHRQDVAGLASVLRRMRAAPDRAEEQRQAAIHRWRDEFSPEAGERRFLKILQSAMDALPA